MVQVRPLIDLEKAKKAQICVQVEPPNKVKLPPMQFSGSSTTDAYNFDYDRVYKLDSKEESRRLFVELVQPLLDRFLMGFNVTVCDGHSCDPPQHVEHVALQVDAGSMLQKLADNTVSSQEIHVYRYLHMGKQGLERPILWVQQPQ